MLSADDKLKNYIKDLRTYPYLAGTQVTEALDKLFAFIDSQEAIIRKQSLALEKCKSQRDEWIEDHCWEPTNKLQQVMTYEKLVEIQNKELEEILKE